MELKPGYKQTEVGVIPEEWRISTLGQLCAFENGDRGRNYPSPDSFVMSGVAFINAGHIAEGKIDLAGMNYTTRERYECLGGGKVKTGDILFCLRGSLGKFGVVNDDLGDGAIASSLVIVRPKTATATREYLCCYFGSAMSAQMIEIWSGGAAQPNLGAQDLARFLIPLPPTQGEQRAISPALSDVDALLSALDRIIAKKRQIKQAAMQELLTGTRRLPGFEGEWVVKRLGDVAPFQRGFDLPNPQLRAGPYPVVYSNGVLTHHACFQVIGPGVVTGRSGTIGKVHFVDADYWPHNTSLWVTNFKGNDPEFIFYLLSQTGLERFASGSGVPTLNRNDIHDYHVQIPSNVDEQAAIASVLSEMDSNLVAAEKQLAKGRALKQGMMQQLLTGRIRLV